MSYAMDLYRHQLAKGYDPVAGSRILRERQNSGPANRGQTATIPGGHPGADLAAGAGAVQARTTTQED